MGRWKRSVGWLVMLRREGCMEELWSGCDERMAQPAWDVRTASGGWEVGGGITCGWKISTRGRGRRVWGRSLFCSLAR